jgi:DNA-binding LacI/PurR family transcriptional regulator
MLTGPADERPDGLVVADDNLAEAATAGVMASGVNAAADLDVVVHCNLPWPPPTMVPVARLGFDIGRVLRTAIDLVDDHRRTDGPPAVVPVPAQFDWELPKTDQGTNQDYTSFENGL